MMAQASPLVARASDPALRAEALASKAWPFEEARKLLARIERTGAREILFETGYGPSGLPHIGTFGEVSRTTMVRHAFATMSDVPTRLLCFSDDMDGLRKVPDNVPNRDQLARHLGLPLTRIPDPFGKFESFGHHNNAMLRDFLDRFGFDYEFASSTDYYAAGRFDSALLRVLECYDEVMAIMLPSLREGSGASSSARTVRLRHAMLISEAALAVMLLIGSGLLIRSFMQLVNVDPGYDAANVLTADIYLPGAELGKADTTAFLDEFLPRVRALPPKPWTQSPSLVADARAGTPRAVRHQGPLREAAHGAPARCPPRRDGR